MALNLANLLPLTTPQAHSRKKIMLRDKQCNISSVPISLLDSKVLQCSKVYHEKNKIKLRGKKTVALTGLNLK